MKTFGFSITVALELPNGSVVTKSEHVFLVANILRYGGSGAGIAV
jgi:hypothetical protein